MKKFNYIAWIKLFLILLFSFIALTSDVRKITSGNSLEILIGSLIFFFIAFFGIPAFFMPNDNYTPRWNDNPFLYERDAEKVKAHLKRFPLIFFHHAGYFILAIGLAGTINNLVRFGNIDYVHLRDIILGTGFLIGVHRATRKSLNTAQ